MRPDLYRMFYPLTPSDREEWANTVRLPAADYEARLAEVARALGLMQDQHRGAVIWTGPAGNPELMLFRIPDPGNLDAIRAMYDAVAEANCPIAYAFINQRGDSVDAWDVFQLSRLSYLCHCNRLAGPGSSCEQESLDGSS